MELIERHIYVVSRRLPVSQRADIEQELRTLIEDMVQERCHGEVGQEQIMALLKELGDPAYLAGQYREEQKYLIGPQLYDTYTLATRILLAASVSGISLIEIVGFFLYPDVMLEGILFQFAALFLRAVCLSFVLATLVFALMERDYYRRASKATWDPATLPKIPKRSQTISISGVAWSVVVSIAMTSVIVMGNPTVQISEVIWIISLVSIPIFSPKGIQTVAPIIVSLLFVGIIRDLVKLASGCWTMKLSVINVLINNISVICYMLFLTKPDIFSQLLVGGLVLRVSWPAGVTGEAQACEIAANVLVYLTVVALITESALSLYHGIRYQFENGQNNSQEGQTTGDMEKQLHILILRKESAEYAIIPRGPKRVKRTAGYLDDVRELAFNREYYSIRGRYKGVPVIVLSTGIGRPSAAIAIEEMRVIGVRTILRIGSCGALQSGMSTGDLIASTGSVRDDGTTFTYMDKGYPAVPDLETTGILQQVCRRTRFRYRSGITRGHDNYYANTAEERTDYWHSRGILGEDLETSTLFVVAGLRGLRAGSILNIVVKWKGDVKEGVQDYVNGARQAACGGENEILAALETIPELEVRKNQEELGRTRKSQKEPERDKEKEAFKWVRKGVYDH